MRLYFDSEACYRDIKSKLLNQVKTFAEELKRKVKSESNNFGKKYGMTEVEVNNTINSGRDLIVAYIETNPPELMDTFGSGSKMDTSRNPILDEYLSSDNFNSEYRSIADTRIKGRPEGEYEDIFGNTRYSHGTFEGLNLEGRIIPNWENDGEGYIEIQPMEPSYAIIESIEWFWAELPFIVSEISQKVDFSKYFIYK